MNILNDKVLPFDEFKVHWCPNMDLIAITSQSENFVAVYRCGNKFQKVF